jgi:arylamine N-acetyltransferase
MKEVRIEIDKDGKIKVLYQGFVGGACFEEARRLYALLKAQGLDVSIEQVTPTQEYYVAVAQKTREVLTNGR